MDFLFHKVGEKEKKDIEKQAKKILDDFSKELSKVKVSVDESLIERNDFERDEGEKCSEINREVMFSNAPNKRGDFILGEKKKW